MDLGLQGRVALVTGASKGLGFAIARTLAEEGVKVAITSRDEDRVQAAASQFGATGFAHDSTNLEGIPILVHEIEHFLGPIDILVTNTGGPPGDADALGFTREQWQDAYDALVLSPMAFVEAVIPSMRRRLWGRIVNVSSIAVREPIPNLVLSNAHRAATLASFKTIARQVAADGVTVNTVLPGRISTDRLYELYGSRETADEVAIQEIPARRLGSPEEFAAAAAFLCSAQAGYITGVALAVDGGMMRSI